MKKNMGAIDTTIRVALAALIAVLYITGVIKGTLALVALIVAVIFVVTSLISFCPLYTVLGFNTCRKKE